MNELAERVNNELRPIYDYDDEYDIPKKFQKALNLGKEVADKLVESEKNNDSNMISFYNGLLNQCYKIFDGHFWGEGYKKDLDTYVRRKRLGQQSTVEHTKELEAQILEISKELDEYIDSLYPLELPEFRSLEEREHIGKLEDKIKSLKEQYSEEYSYLSPEEKKTISLNYFTVKRRDQCGLETVRGYDDEYDIPKKFSKALNLGKTAVDQLAECMKNNDQKGIERCNRIIASSFVVFDSHFWGERYKNELNSYKERLKTLSNEESSTMHR